MSSVEETMQCDICKRDASDKLGFHCALCARDAIYPLRLQHAEVLLEKEAREKQVEEAMTGNGIISKTSSTTSKNKSGHPTWVLQSAEAERAISEDKTEAIREHVQSLRETTQQMKEEIATRKAQLEKRRDVLKSSKEALARWQDTAIEPVDKAVRRTNSRWDQLQEKTVEGRIFLCKEAADLYGLDYQRRKKESKEEDIYTIAGAPIVDLRELNSNPLCEHSLGWMANVHRTDAPYSSITVSNTHVAHLVHLLSHYLSLRLPAEITLPHRDYPYPTIFSPTSSYTTNRSVPFPGSTPSHSSSNSPTASRHQQSHQSSTTQPADHETRPLPRPRTLHLDKPLSILAKEDQIAYSTFVEGVTLLAWDVAWLCRTQGMSVGTTTWEDVCAMGKNLYQLVFTSATTSSIHRPTNPANNAERIQDTTTAVKSKGPVTNAPLPPQHPPPPPPAYFSHNSSYAPLIMATGAAYMRTGWRLNLPVKVIDKVKAMLLAERTGAEWEILDAAEGDEFQGLDEGKIGDGVDAVADGYDDDPADFLDDDGGGKSGTTVVKQTPSSSSSDKAKGKDKVQEKKDPLMNPVSGAPAGGPGSGGTGGHGWMKLKSRTTSTANTTKPPV